MTSVRDYMIHYLKKVTKERQVMYWNIVWYDGDKRHNQVARTVYIDTPSVTFEDKNSNSKTRFYIKATGVLKDCGSENFRIVEE